LKNGNIINASSLWPSLLISQMILWPNLCSKTLLAFAEDFLDQDLSNVLISRQGEVLPGSLSLDSPSKKGNKRKLITLTEVSPFT
jgi:hypothetical protein